MKLPNRVKTCCTRCGNDIGDSFCLDKNLNVRVNKTPTFCNDCVALEFNDFKYISPNKQLAGPANPKTLIPPVVAPPIADLSYWKTNNLITHSHINAQREQPLYESGFIVTSCCDKKDCYLTDNCCYTKDTPIAVPYEKKESVTITPDSEKETFTLPYEKNKPPIKENLRQDRLKQIQINLKDSEPKSLQYSRDVDVTKGQDGIQIQAQRSISTLPRKRVEKCCIPQDINITCGYNKENPFLYDVPTNYAISNCEKSESLKCYNKNLFTQTIQPGIYTRSEVNETPNSNIGISFAQPFEPVSVSKDCDGILFTQHDPNLIANVIEPSVDYCDEPTIYNVYDPRCSGYGTSYRAYNNDLLGQTRFMYDDVDAIRNPNYLTRSHVDHLPFADKYGPMQPCGMDGNIYTGRMREMVNQVFTDSTNQFRAELQERLMRKANNIAWQQRKAPISRNGFCAK